MFPSCIKLKRSHLTVCQRNYALIEVNEEIFVSQYLRPVIIRFEISIIFKII